MTALQTGDTPENLSSSFDRWAHNAYISNSAGGDLEKSIAHMKGALIRAEQDRKKSGPEAARG